RAAPPTSVTAHGDMHAPSIFTLRSGIAEGRMVFLGVGGDINGKVNPTLNVHEGERSEEHTSELQSPDHLVCRLLLEKKKETQKGRRLGALRDWRRATGGGSDCGVGWRSRRGGGGASGTVLGGRRRASIWYIVSRDWM